MNKAQLKVYYNFKEETKDKFSIASQFQILDQTDEVFKEHSRNELFEFQHAGVNYCICGHDDQICHPTGSVCYNRKCSCLQYISSKYNDKLDMIKENKS